MASAVWPIQSSLLRLIPAGHVRRVLHRPNHGQRTGRNLDRRLIRGVPPTDQRVPAVHQQQRLRGPYDLVGRQGHSVETIPVRLHILRDPADGEIHPVVAAQNIRCQPGVFLPFGWTDERFEPFPGLVVDLLGTVDPPSSQRLKQSDDAGRGGRRHRDADRLKTAGKRRILGLVAGQPQRQLPDASGAHRRLRLPADSHEGRNGKTHQQRDQEDHDQQLDQRESARPHNPSL